MGLVNRLNKWGEREPRKSSELEELRLIRKRLGWIIFFLILTVIGISGIYDLL